MPLYEYKCEKCDEKFEILRWPNEKDEVVCPKCKKPAKKLVTGFTVGRGNASLGSDCAGGGRGGCFQGGGG